MTPPLHPLLGTAAVPSRPPAGADTTPTDRPGQDAPIGRPTAPKATAAPDSLGAGAATALGEQRPPASRAVSTPFLTHGCAEAFADIEPQGLAVTYTGTLDHDPVDGPVSVAFAATRAGADGQTVRVARTVTVSNLPATGGRFALTGRFVGLTKGLWQTEAVLLEAHTGAGRGPVQREPRATRPAVLAYGPAVRVWSWPVLVAAGAVLALVMQAAGLAGLGLNLLAVAAIAVLGCLLGFVGAKMWYLVLHRRPLRTFLQAGACIQGFLLTAFAVLAAGAVVAHMPVGAVVDATAPGVFLGMALGRPGCFLTGCCAGRPTASRWGMWSSDRTLTIKRVPVQLLEAAATLGIGLVALSVAATGTAPIPGALFVGTIAAYILVRQGLFPYRADPHTRRGRQLTMALAAVVLAAVVALFVLR